MQKGPERVLPDACVMANFAVCDLLLRLGEQPALIAPFWSEQILQEVYRTHTHALAWENEQAATFQNAVRKAFPHAMITGHDPLIPLMTNHPNDRHVMAAAVHVRVPVLLTFNLKDFRLPEPKTYPDLFQVKVMHPDAYLCKCFRQNPELVRLRLHEIATRRKTDFAEAVRYLGKALPRFSEEVIGSGA